MKAIISKSMLQPLFESESSRFIPLDSRMAGEVIKFVSKAYKPIENKLVSSNQVSSENRYGFVIDNEYYFMPVSFVRLDEAADKEAAELNSLYADNVNKQNNDKVWALFKRYPKTLYIVGYITLVTVTSNTATAKGTRFLNAAKLFADQAQLRNDFCNIIGNFFNYLTLSSNISYVGIDRRNEKIDQYFLSYMEKYFEFKDLKGNESVLVKTIGKETPKPAPNPSPKPAPKPDDSNVFRQEMYRNYLDDYRKKDDTKPANNTTISNSPESPKGTRDWEQNTGGSGENRSRTRKDSMPGGNTAKDYTMKGDHGQAGLDTFFKGLEKFGDYAFNRAASKKYRG